jgi:hypothetical protein
VINISNVLGKATPEFDLYAEGTVASRGRIDLVGFNGDIAFALEAKNFGAINSASDSILRDFHRLRCFVPSLTEVAGNIEARRWWQEARQRWGIIVISSYRGPEVKDAWLASDEADMRRLMSGYSSHEQPREVDGAATGFLALHRALASAVRGAEVITDSHRWIGAGQGWLLWAGVPLPPSGQAM